MVKNLLEVYELFNKKRNCLSLSYVDGTIIGRTKQWCFTISETGQQFEIVFTDNHYEYSMILADAAALMDFLTDLDNHKITIEKNNNIHIKLSGWDNFLKRKKSLVKRIILDLIAALLLYYSASLTAYIIMMLADTAFSFTENIMLLPHTLGTTIIAVAMIRYGRQQYRYKKNIVLFCWGIFLISSSLVLMIAGWLGYPNDEKYGLGTYIGITVLFSLIILVGVLLVFLAYFVKRSNKKSIYLLRKPILPSTEELEMLLEAIRQKASREVIKIIPHHDTEPTLFSSKLGGLPYWNLNQPYPVSENDKKMVMLMQIMLCDLPENEYLPKEGMIQFFVEDEEEIIQSKVIYHKEINYDLSEEKVRELDIPLADKISAMKVDELFDKESVIPLAFERTEILSTENIEEVMFSSAEELGIVLDKTLTFQEISDERFRKDNDQSGFLLYKPALSTNQYDMVLLHLDLCDDIPGYYEEEKLNICIDPEALKRCDFSDVLAEHNVEW